MSELLLTDQSLKPIADRVRAGERLSFDEGVQLYRSPDLLAVGWLANHVREKKHGNATYYNVNRHINPTNVCVAHCKLCAFGRDPNSPGAYTYALDEIYQRADQGVREGATEFHIVGGLHPDLPFEYFLELISGLKKRHPQVHLKAFTMVEVHYFARIAKLSIEETLQKMKAAGVDSCPGGGAEIFHPRVRRIICDHKVSGNMWLTLARKTHEAGLHSNATMLYGHVETEEERVDHLVKLRELQDVTRGFVAFIPLAFHPDNSALSHIPKPTGYDDLRNIAVSRLLLDNFEHIKAYWIMLTPSIAQIALRFGATNWTEQLSKKRFTTTQAPKLPSSRPATSSSASSAPLGAFPSSATRFTTKSIAPSFPRSRPPLLRASSPCR
jgi:aminodeoxyfutalosine synthase